MVKLQQTAKISHKFIDYKIGKAGAIFLGGLVFGINYFATHEISGSATAALKQGGYTFLFGGIFMKGCENFTTTLKTVKQLSFLPDILQIRCDTICGGRAPGEPDWPKSKLKMPAPANLKSQ